MSKMDLYEKVKEAEKNNFIMGAGTNGDNCKYDAAKDAKRKPIGICCGHAFTVLGAAKYSDDFPQAVKIYNPWGANWYTGAIANQDQSKGIFYVTLDEFHENWGNTDIAEVRKGSVVSPIVLKTETQGVVALEFDMNSDDPFSVQLEWPTWRFYNPGAGDGKANGCEVRPDGTAAIAKLESPWDYTVLGGASYYAQISNARASLAGGSGTYVIYVQIAFPVSKSWLKEFVVNVYGPPTELRLSKTYADPGDLASAMGLQGQYSLVGSDLAEDEDGSCGKYIDRMSKLNNGAEIARTGRDSLFPESMESISRPGVSCGDSAAGKSAKCEKFNNWASLRVLKDGVQCPSDGYVTLDKTCNCRAGGTKTPYEMQGKTWYYCKI